ncbi:hypothetical protein ACSRUE_37835 [Sorangium sp. KYC3313]|uniref:hypothetical protein n=1 Tax=Sorangium sp. KYC3313 TaxID=3449740 RepID=UPI003F88D24F
MSRTALDRFLRIAAGAPSEKRWSQLFALVGEWPGEARAAEKWTDRADTALASWPDASRVAVMSEEEQSEPEMWMWGVAPDIGPAPWLRLVRTLWTSVAEVLAAPPGGGWEQSGFGAVRRFHLRDKLSSFGEAARATARLPALAALNLSSAILFPPTPSTVRAGWVDLLQAAANSHVVDLNVARMPLDPAMIGQLVGSQAARGLAALNVSESRTPFGDEAASVLARWPAGASIEALWLARDGLTDRGATHLWECGALDSLRVLGLNGNGLTGASFAALASRERAALIELDLRGNQISDSAVEVLFRASLPALRSLRLENNRLTTAGVRRVLAWAATKPALVCTVKPLH